ncbi:hypothetical protein [Daejeonella sp.]|uniref:hypothetical protein n=1 Tax=Daejeonella sp. TaxID=2805397 RepID=UPI002732498F|nr:hypothetical protein [Daejeonella sp.]
MKYLITLILLLSFETSKGQSLTLDQLVNLQMKDLEYVNEFHLNRGWRFDSSVVETDDRMGRAVWAFGKSEFDTERAVGWFNLIYSPGYESTITYQIHNKNFYSLIKNRITALGMKLAASEILDDGLYSVYVGQKYAVKIVSSSSSDEIVPKYIFTILPKSQYYNSLD